MTTAVDRRSCSKCGHAKDPSAFPKRGNICNPCKSAARRLKRRQAAKAKERKPLKVRVPKRPGGRTDIVWHQCGGADVHPAHVELHRRGFWTEGNLPIGFIEGYCTFPEGPLHGQPATLIPWQREMILQLYRVRPDGIRQYRRALVGVAKKNNKSGLVAWLSLYHTVADPEPTPINVCAAASDDQADIVFGFATETAENGRNARDAEPGVNLHDLTVRWEKMIEVPSRPRTTLQRLAAAGGNLDGPNLYFRALDELHEWTTPKAEATYTVLAQGGALREAPLLFAITTAGWDPDTICYRLYEHGKQVEADPELDPTFFFWWFEAPILDADEQEIHYQDRAGWEAANPSAGFTTSYERFLEDCDDPELTEAKMRRYRLNQWTESEERWLPPGALEACRVSQKIQLDPDRRTVAAIDASTKYDSTAVKVCDATGLDEDDLVVREVARIWERPVNPATGNLVADWTLPIEEVGWHLFALHFGTHHDDEEWCRGGVCRCCGRAFRPLGLEAIGFDPAFITWEAERWATAGLPMVEIPQTNARMIRGTQGLYRLITEGRFRHEGDPVSERHFRNAATKTMPGGGERLVKPKTSRRKRIDGGVASAMEAYLLLEGPPKDETPPKPSVHVFPTGGGDDED